MSKSIGSQDVCVIGLGDMGSALAEAFLAKGHRVTVWNRTAAKGAALGEIGAWPAESLPEAVEKVRMVVVCVLDHAAAASLLMSDQMARALRGKLLVQLSTVTAEESRTLDRWARENSIDYLDGSILGYRQDVLEDRCPIVYSGPKASFEANRELLTAMGGAPRLLGETVGSVAVFDKAIYSFHWGTMAAFFHGAAMCHAAGFPTELYADLVLGPMLGNTKRALRRYGEMIATRSYAPESIDVDVMAYEHVIRLSERLGVDTAFPETVLRYIRDAETRDEQSLAAIFELMLANRRDGGTRQQ